MRYRDMDIGAICDLDKTQEDFSCIILNRITQLLFKWHLEGPRIAAIQNPY